MAKTTLTINDLHRNSVAPTLKGLDTAMTAAKAKVPAELFPELKLSKTYRFTNNVLHEHAAKALQAFDGTSEASVKLAEAYTNLDAMLFSGIYAVDETFATVLRSELYKLRNAVKELAGVSE